MIIPNVEHISILFSPTAHSTSRSWLDATFGPQPEASNYTDRRILWFGLGIIGSIFLSKATLSRFPATIREKVLIAPQWLRLIALLGGSLDSHDLSMAGKFRRSKVKSVARIVGWRIYPDLVRCGRGDQSVNTKTSFIQADNHGVT